MEAKATSPGRVGRDALVREIFEEIDEDGSGFLEFTEIGDLLDRLGLRIDDDEVSATTFEVVCSSSSSCCIVAEMSFGCTCALVHSA